MPSFKLTKSNVFSILIASFFIGSCQDFGVESPDLSGGYWLLGDWKMIRSRTPHYYNTIYSVVTDYTFNKDFILAEQQPRKDDYIGLLGEDLFRRFENYSRYEKDPNILNDSFYSFLRGKVEKDSLLYRLFIHRGALKDESANRAIGIHMAQDLIEHDPYYRKILSNKVNYWIIYHPSDTLIGPLTQQEYLDRKTTLGVPATLKLKFEK